jgi:MarR family transcriptional regulator, organic hydroperoxide resistance regulator
LCFALYSAANALGRVYAVQLDRLGLTYPQYLAMLVLWERDDVSLTAIGRRLFLDSGTLTPLLKRLEQAGLVERRRDPADERQIRIRLTPAGNRLRDAARLLPQALACAIDRPADDLAALRDDLFALRASLMASLETADPAASTDGSAADTSPRGGLPHHPPPDAEIMASEGEHDAS